MGCGESKSVSCPNCNYTFDNGEDFLRHLQQVHHFMARDAPDNWHRSATASVTCPGCNTAKFESGQALVNHLQYSHGFLPGEVRDDIECPKCNTGGFSNIKQLVSHIEKSHQQSPRRNLPIQPVVQAPTISTASGRSSLPRVGDKILAMWVKTKWQYFDATIRRFIPETLQYEIEWDDQDPSGRIVDYYNLALNKVPNEKDIGVGSIVLFRQGGYRGQEGVRLGGKRWHQGRITGVSTQIDGTRVYDGVHTKGHADEKWVTYKGYSYQFTGLRLEDFRVGPNVFDLLDTNEAAGDASEEDIDIFFSYNAVDSPNAIQRKEVKDVPNNYFALLNQLCDPRQIANNLKEKGLKIAEGKIKSNEGLKETVSRMKQAKVFIACISDQYVANDQCRMEFQFAKTSLKLPVVPVVVGDGSFEWQSSVVGMLIAGELFIHFKDKSVEQVKLGELSRTLSTHLDKNDDILSSTANQSLLSSKEDVDIFISYSWSNSKLAKEAKQVQKLVGHEFADPRLVKKELENIGLNAWLDIERLQSANVGAGMYEQISGALKDAKVVVIFVSDEYAASDNCRMECQFAIKSLGKPVIPVVVGHGDEWKTSVIGALVSGSIRQPINLQGVSDRNAFENQLQILQGEIQKMADFKLSPRLGRGAINSRAPKVGDRVLSHHKNCAYYMATVASFNSETMEYTVNWDDLDLSGRTQPFNQVALDVIPDPDDVGVGSIVFFPQGHYSGIAGNNVGGLRYHEGVVTMCRKEKGTILVSGKHTKSQSDGKWVTYKNYNYVFYDVPLEMIRIASSAMDIIMDSFRC